MKQLHKYIASVLTPLSLGCVPTPNRCDYASEKNNPACAAYFDVVSDSEDVQVDSIRGRNPNDLEQVVQDVYQINDAGTDIGDDAPLDLFVVDYEMNEGNDTFLDTSTFDDGLNVEIADSIFMTDEIGGKLDEVNLVDETAGTGIDSILLDSATDVVYLDALDGEVDVAVDGGMEIVVPQNTKPVFNALGNKSVAEGQKLVLQLSATDAENDTIVYTISANALTGTTFNAKTGKFTFTPDYTFVTHPNIVKSTSFTFGAFDGKEYAEPLTMQVTVQDTNRLPKITSTPALEAMVDALYTYQIGATDEDAEDVLSYTLVNGLTGMTLKDKILSWTPNKSQVGKQALEIAVSDGMDTVSQKGMVEVKDVPCYTNSFATKSDSDLLITQTGSWSWDPNGYIQGTGIAYLNTKEWSDFEVSVNIKQVSPGSTHATHFFIRYTPNGNPDKGYDLILSNWPNECTYDGKCSTGNSLYFSGLGEKKDFVIVSLPFTDNEMGQWHTLGVKAVGDKITGSIDNKEMFTVTNTSYSSGKFGFATNNTISYFKDLKVCPL